MGRPIRLVRRRRGGSWAAAQGSALTSGVFLDEGAQPFAHAGAAQQLRGFRARDHDPVAFASLGPSLQHLLHPHRVECQKNLPSTLPARHDGFLAGVDAAPYAALLVSFPTGRSPARHARNTAPLRMDPFLASRPADQNDPVPPLFRKKTENAVSLFSHRPTRGQEIPLSVPATCCRSACRC